jgi:hypothetical protein
METLTIRVKNKNALAILRGLEKAGLIDLSELKENSRKNLSRQLRGSISTSRAEKMIESIDKERDAWEDRF